MKQWETFPRLHMKTANAFGNRAAAANQNRRSLISDPMILSDSARVLRISAWADCQHERFCINFAHMGIHEAFSIKSGTNCAGQDAFQ